MPEYNHTRREFIKQNSLAVVGAVVAAGTPTVLYASQKNHAPAILGGNPSWTKDKWPTWPRWNPETDEKKLLEVMRSGVWSRAGVVTEFEKAWADALGVKRSLAVVNGTNALVTAISQFKIQAGDEVLVPPYTFIASVSAILTNGAMPVLLT